MLGIGADSRFSHQMFTQNVGGIPYPVLSDFHPKGEVSMAYDVWNPDLGTSRRAIVIIDSRGVIRYKKVWSSGRPDPKDVLEDVRKID